MSSLLLRSQVGKNVVQESLTQFLYRTPTLLQSYATSGEGAAASSRRKPKPRTSTQPRPGVGDSDARRPTRRSRSFPSQRQNIEDDNSIYSIPFEGDTLSKLEGTTMTPKEFYKFETLMRKKSKTQARETISGQPQTSHNILENKPLKPDFPKPLQDLAKEAQTIRNRSRSTSAAVLDVPSEYFVKVKDRMDQASSDVALWSILQNDVLDQIIALRDQFGTNQMQKLQETYKLNELSKSVPQLLVHCTRILRTTFQGSLLAPVLLPSLKDLGPAAFALMATTELYNEHIHVLYQQDSDLDGIVRTLSEMDQEVYEFNKGTQDLLSSILKHAHASIRGRNGQGQQALWLTDRKTRLLAKLERWNQTVEMRVQSAAIRKVRENSADLVEA